MTVKNLIFIGGGGFAKELIGYIKYEQSIGRYAEYILKGVLDDSRELIQSFCTQNSLVDLGEIRSYKPSNHDVFIVAIGSNPARKNIISLLLDREMEIFTFVSSLAFVSSTAKVGSGCVVAPFCILNANAKLGDYALMNSYSAIGHDSEVGAHAILYPYAVINGNCNIGHGLTMGTRATVFPGVKIGNNCTITTHSYVKKNKKNNRFIHIKSQEIDLENRF